MGMTTGDGYGNGRWAKGGPWTRLLYAPRRRFGPMKANTPAKRGCDGGRESKENNMETTMVPVAGGF